MALDVTDAVQARWSKTDQECQGCAVRHWLTAAGLTDDDLFRGGNRHRYFLPT